MSMETHVFFTGSLPSKADLERRMQELGFPFKIIPPHDSLEGQKGFLPMMNGDAETGVEFDVFDGKEDTEFYENVGADPSLDRIANFRWGGDFQEAAAGMCGAAALAGLVGGVVFDEAEDRLMSVDEAIEVARSTLDFLASGKF
jgi:hypothetical protein